MTGLAFDERLSLTHKKHKLSFQKMCGISLECLTTFILNLAKHELGGNKICPFIGTVFHNLRCHFYIAVFLKSEFVLYTALKENCRKASCDNTVIMDKDMNSTGSSGLSHLGYLQ